MKVKHIILFISLALLPIFAMAQISEIKYFEFAPDTSEKFSAVRRGEIIQPFIASNDLISGFDLWLDNSTAGNMSISLLNDNNQILASKTVSVPIISPKWGGESFHITFSQPVPVFGNQIYKIKITNASADVNVYYASRVAPLEHNAAYSPLEKIVSPAIISGVEQNFSVKFALYDNSSDTLLPVLSNISSSISSNFALFQFNANEPVDFKITIESADKTQSQTDPFKNDYQICNQSITTCNSVFSVSPNTQYNYQISAKDQWGNEIDLNGVVGESIASTASSTQTDATPPIISNIRVLSLNQNSAVFAWTTNEPANSSVLIGLSGPGRYQILTSVGDSVYELEHAIYSGSILMPNTSYFASIMSIDLSGNIANQYIEFTTLPALPPTEQPPTTQPPATQPPQPLPTTSPTSTPPAVQNEIQNLLSSASSSIQNPQLPAPSITPSEGDASIEINWAAPPNEPSSGYRIDIFDTNYNLVKKLSVPKGNHYAILNGVSSGKYKAIVYADNNGVFEKVAKPADFTVPQKPVYKNIILYIALLALLTIAVGAIFYFIKSKKETVKAGQSGLTLIEILVAMGIATLIIVFIGYFIRNVINFKTFFGAEIMLQQEFQQTIQTIVPEARSMKISALGDYPIAEVSSSSFTFFSDIDGDAVVEKVKYFVESATLKKGVIDPSGNPLSYDPASQITTEMVHNLNMGTSTVFSYYDANYSGSEAAMSYPVNISLVREIGVLISAKDEDADSSETISIKIAPRNLRTNL